MYENLLGTVSDKCHGGFKPDLGSLNLEMSYTYIESIRYTPCLKEELTKVVMSYAFYCLIIIYYRIIQSYKGFESLF